MQSAGLVRFLNQRLKTDRPAVVVKEAALSLAAYRELGTGEDAIRSAYGLSAVVTGVCGFYGVPCRDVSVAVATKHFTGMVRHGGRAARKKAIIAQCKALGYLPKDCLDDNRADALAMWDWACAHLARSPRALALWGAE